MTERMSLTRFEAMVAAYGATPNRWPGDERAAAEAFARGDPRAHALLAEADGIDALLFAHRVAEPSRTLRMMVTEGAQTVRPRRRGVRLWWAGLGIALAASGGALAGSAATAALEPSATQQIYENDVAAYDDVPEEIAP